MKTLEIIQAAFAREYYTALKENLSEKQVAEITGTAQRDDFVAQSVDSGSFMTDATALLKDIRDAAIVEALTGAFRK